MTNEEEGNILEALQSLPSGEVLGFLERQRWFAAKGAAPTAARVADAVVLPWGAGRFAIARVIVGVGGAEQTYQVPVAWQSPAPTNAAHVVGSARGMTIVDAVHDPEFRSELARAALSGAAVDGANGTRWIADATGAVAFRPDAAIETTLGSAEQSNTSIVIGNGAILKLFRNLKAGVHPDVEVTRFLTTRAHFANTPLLLASMAFQRDGQTTTAGMVQEFLPGSTDAWTYALDRGAEYFSAPAKRDVPNNFLGDASRLGAITRAMHEALACDDDDPAFAPEPVSDDDLDRWVARTQQSIRDSLALLESRLSSPGFPKERVGEATALVGRGEHYIGWLSEIGDELADGDDLGMCTRVHGDYHLGQVLRTAQGDFMVIDFEGEPSRSLEERREKTSPLRDVAGMLRSFAYAAATLAMSAGNKIDVQTLELRSARWERDVRAAYLAGYLGDAAERDEHPDVIPENEANVRKLISLFETEKAFYELSYELNNRPAWVGIPMRGIAKLFTR
jgi:trehalose synthase-fused probable maltokinase